MQNNHKFIQFSIILLDIFVAGYIANLLFSKNKKYLKMSVGIILLVVVTSTGICEFFTFINRNKDVLSMNMRSEMVEWIKQNTKKDDVFLTPMWVGNEFFLSGRISFLAYPYYAWTAGHKTDEREKEYRYLLKGADADKEKFINICKKNNIKYIIDDTDLFNVVDEETKESIYNQEFIRNNFELLVKFEDKNTSIYKVYD